MDKVTELMVTREKTAKAGDEGEWLQIEHSANATIDQEKQFEVPKARIEGILVVCVSSALKAQAQLLQLDPDELAKLTSKTGD